MKINGKEIIEMKINGKYILEMKINGKVVYVLNNVALSSLT